MRLYELLKSEHRRYRQRYILLTAKNGIRQRRPADKVQNYRWGNCTFTFELPVRGPVPGNI